MAEPSRRELEEENDSLRESLESLRDQIDDLLQGDEAEEEGEEGG